jgi:hypothetical protein
VLIPYAARFEDSRAVNVGILSVDTVPVPENPDSPKPATEATPTFLSGESLTFPLITGVGTAAITLYAAVTGVEPTVKVVVIVAIICGLIVTIWGYIDANAATTTKRKIPGGELFKRVVIGVLNTVLLASALWGAVAVSQVAFAAG